MNKYVKNSIKVAVSAGLIFLLLKQINIQDIAAKLSSANGWWLLVTFLLFAGSIILRAIRWKVLLDALDIRVPLMLLSRWYYIGAFFNTLLPTGFGGDVARSMYLARYSSQAASAVGTVLLDRFLGILVLLGVGVLALPFGRAEISGWVQLFVLAVFIAAAGGFWLFRQGRLVAAVRRRIMARVPAGLRSWPEGLDWLRPLYTALQGYDRATLVKAMVASLVFNTSWIAINITAGLALGIHASLIDYLVFVPLVSLALLLPSIGGIGVRELGYVGLFSQIGVPEESAFALSIIVYGVTVATGLIGGIILLFQNFLPSEA